MPLVAHSRLAVRAKYLNIAVTLNPHHFTYAYNPQRRIQDRENGFSLLFVEELIMSGQQSIYH